MTWVTAQVAGNYSAEGVTYLEVSFGVNVAAGSLVVAFGSWMAPSGYSGFEELATPGDTFGDGAAWQTAGKALGGDGLGGAVVTKLWYKVVGTSPGSGKMVAIQNQGSSSGNVGLIIANFTPPLPLKALKAGTYSGNSGIGSTLNLTSFAAGNNIMCVSAGRVITTAAVNGPSSWGVNYNAVCKADFQQIHCLATYFPTTNVTADPDWTITGSHAWCGNAAGFESWAKPPPSTTFFQYLLSQKAFG